MRKNISKLPIVLTGILLLNGCGASADSQTTAENIPLETESTQSSAEEEASSTSDTEVSSSEAEETDTNDTFADIPIVSITTDNQSYYSDDGNILLLDETTCQVSLLNDGFEKLASSIDAQFNQPQTSGEDEYSLVDEAKEHYNLLEDKTYFMSYYFDTSIEMARCDSSLLSLVVNSSEYTGGAHGYYSTGGYTYDVTSGELLNFKDLLADEEGFCSVATDYVMEHLNQEYGQELFPEVKETVSDSWTNESGVAYYLDSAGIEVIYNPYEVGPYSMGQARVLLPYEQFGAYLKDEYQLPQGNSIALLPANVDISSSLGITAPFMIEVIEDDNEFNGISVLSGSVSSELEYAQYLQRAYLMQNQNGMKRLIVCADYASDDYCTYVFDITDGGLNQCDKLDGANITGNGISHDSIELGMHLDVLGTYEGEMPYQINEDGTLTQKEEIFNIHSSFKMNVMKELPVTIDNEETTLAPGTVITITGTDNIDTAYFITSEGEKGAIHYTTSDDGWSHLIDGVSENDYFDMIPYAG